MANNGQMGKVELYAISLLFTLPFTKSLEQAMDVMTVLLGNLAPDGINFLKRVLTLRIGVIYLGCRHNPNASFFARNSSGVMITGLSYPALCLFFISSIGCFPF